MGTKAMNEVISATEARVHLGAVLDRLQQDGGPIIVERGGQAQAVLLSLATYERLSWRQAGSETKLLERARSLRQRVAQRSGGPLPDPTKILHELRDERDEDTPDLR
mgnify:CR=1 FL=1